MNKCYNQVVNRILKDAEKEMMNLKHPYVGTEHLLLSLLKKEKVKNVCYKFMLTYTNFRTELLNIMGSATKKSEQVLYTPLLKIVLEHAYNKAYDEHKEMNELHLLAALLGETDGIALRIIDNMGVDVKEVAKELNAPILTNELGINLNLKAPDEKILLREKELNELMQILLRKNKNNPLLVGKAGVGKTALVEELARRIKNGKVPEKLREKEIILINTSSLIAGTKYRGEFEERVNNLVKEVINNKNIILFIDEIHNIIKTGASDGSIDAANILKPYLARGELSIIGATTTEEYNEYIKKDAALSRRFAPITVNEPTLAEMEQILLSIKTSFEKYYNLVLPPKTVSFLIKECDLHLPNLYNPDKCIDIIDTVCSKKTLDNYQAAGKSRIITNEDISAVIRARINLKNVNKSELENLKSELSLKYNEQLIKNITSIIQSNTPNKYMLLNGGEQKQKAKIIKTIAERLGINLIDIDCAEYNDEYSLNRLLANNYLYNKLADEPYSIVMFNNYQASNKVLYNLINTMLKSGYIANSKNEKLSLNSAIIFLLDNASVGSLGFNNKNNLLFAN